MIVSPHFDTPPEAASPQIVTTTRAALEAISAIYTAQTEWLLARFEEYKRGEITRRARAFYPQLRLTAPEGADSHSGARLLPGHVYQTTLTRPALFNRYLSGQLDMLLAATGEIEVNVSDTPIPLPFAAAEGLPLGETFDVADMQGLKAWFDMPDLAYIDDRIVNGELDLSADEPWPLALFEAQRIDYSLLRLRHYCGARPEDFQRFVLFTNYQDYIDDFIDVARAQVCDPNNPATAFVGPGGATLTADGSETGSAPKRTPQMPAYHLQRPDGDGVTIVNIGVGPSNAKTITDHIAVLRPDAWLMIGHCAGLRKSQRLGDYVLAHAYVRDDHVLDEDLPPWAPVPALAEVQVALEQAVEQVTGLTGQDRKQVMRTGTVATVDNRNWELLRQRGPNRRLSLSRAVALDMESATIAANGFRMRAPYGTLLCVSDKPLHGELKLPGMADAFYRQQVRRHLLIGLAAVDNMRGLDADRLHSRKLRAFDEPPMR